MSHSVLIISYHFYPDRAVGAKRVSELAIWLRERGVRVTVVAPRINTDARTSQTAAKQLNGIRVVHVPVPPKFGRFVMRLVRKKADAARTVPQNGRPVVAAREDGLSRIKRYYHSLEALVDSNKFWSFLVFMRILFLRLANSFDLVVSSGPPMSPHLAARLAKALFRARWCMDLRDPWVGNEHVFPEVQSRLRDVFEVAAEKTCIMAADTVACASPGIAAELKQRYPDVRDRVSVVLNGYDGDPLPGIQRRDGVLRLLYAGSLYFNRSPFPLLETIEQLVREGALPVDKIELVLVGDCRDWNGVRLNDWAENHAPGGWLKILDAVGAAELRDLIRRVDVLVNFAQGQPKQIPAKTFEYIAANRQMLLIAERDSNTGQLVEEAGFGRVVEPDDRAGLREAILDFYQYFVLDARQYSVDRKVIEKYRRAVQYERLWTLIATVTG